MLTFVLAFSLAAGIFTADEPGLAVGTKPPAFELGFELKDQNGQTRTLQSLMGPKGLMLVFYRSADW